VSWRLDLYAGGLGVIPFVLGLKYLKESPRWLVATAASRRPRKS